MHDHLSPADAAAVASAGRRLLRAHQITHHQRLAELGLVAITKRRVRIAWGCAMASRQVTSRYQLLVPATESTARPVPQALEILVIEPSLQQREAAAGLAAIAARRREERRVHVDPR